MEGAGSQEVGYYSNFPHQVITKKGSKADTYFPATTKSDGAGGVGIHQLRGS